MTLSSPHAETAPASPGRRRIDLNWLLLGLLWLAHAIGPVLWLRLDNRFPSGEAARQLTAGLRVADSLARPSLDLFSRLAEASAGQPPLYYLLSAPLVWIFGRGPDPVTLINLVWLALLMVGVFALTRRLFPAASAPQDARPPLHWPALAAAALVSLYPLVVASIRIYDPALAVAALAALAVWLLAASDGLQRRGYAVGAGLALAAGLLTSVDFWAALLGPTLLVAVQALRTPRPARHSRRTPSRNALERFGRRLRLAPAHVNLLLLLLLVGLALPWAARLPTFAPRGSFQTWLDALGGLPLLALVAGAGYGLWQLIRPRRAGAAWAYGLLLAWLGLGLLLLALLGEGGAGRWMPLLPAAAIVSLAWLAPTELPALLKAGAFRAGNPARLGGLVAALLLFVAGLSALLIAWGAPTFLAGALPTSRPPQREKSQTAAIGQAAARLCGEQTTCRTVVLSCAPFVSADAFTYFLAQSQLEGQLSFARLAPDVNFFYDLWDADFVLSNAAGHGCSAADGLDDVELRRAGVAQTALATAEFGQRFRSAETFDLPDGAQAQLWRRVGPPISQLDAAEQVRTLEHILAVTPSANAANQALSTLLAEGIGDPARALALREEIVERSPQDSVARAALGDLYLAYGRPQEAVAQYEGALTGAASTAGGPSGTGAILLKLAAAHERLGQWTEAEAALTAAGEQSPGNFDILLRQGQFYTARGRFADATRTLALARAAAPDRFEVYLALGQAQLLRGALDQAEEQFELARQAAPTSPEPLLVWADALAARGAGDRASQLYGQAVDLASAGGAEGAIVDATSRWIASLEALGSWEQAAALAETLARTYPRSAQAQATLARLNDRRGQADEAITAWQAALTLAPQDVAARVGLAQALASAGRIDEAQDVVQQGLALPAGRAELLTAAGDLLAAQGTQGPTARQAIERYQEALTVNPAHWPAAARLAQFFLSRDQAAQALQTADAAVQRWPELYQLHALRGDALRQLGRQAEALSAYRQAIELAPTPLTSADPLNAALAHLHSRLGEAQLAGGNFSAAEESFRQALRYAADQVDAQIGLARLNTVLALRAAGATVGSTPHPAAVGGVAAPVATDQARFRAALTALEAARATQPDSVAAATALGELYGAYGRTDEAIAAYQEALQLDPAQAEEARADLFAIYLAQGRADEVIAFYRQLLRENPDSVSSLAGLADAYIAAGESDAALDAYDLFIVQNRDNVAALLAQGATLRSLGLDEQAVAPLERAVRLSGVAGSTQPTVELAGALASLGRVEEAEAAYRAALKVIEDPEHAAELSGDPAAVYVGLARLLLRENRIDEAEAIAAGVLADRPDSAAVQILAGDLSRFRGARAEALAAFRRAETLAPGNVVAHTRVGDLLLESGSLAEAQTAYEAALAGAPGDISALLGLARTLSRAAAAEAGLGAAGGLTPTQSAALQRAQQLVDAALSRLGDASSDTARAALLVRADLLAAQGEVSAAADAYQAVLLQDPENATAIEGLARMLLAAGAVDEALARYQAAADAAATPEVRNRWLMTMAAAYRSLARPAEAEQVYQEILAADPANSAARQALGDLYQAAGRLDEAVAQYRLAREAAPADDVDTAFRLGRALLQVGQVTEAGQIAQALLTASPSAWQSYLLAARVASAQGDPAASLASLRQAQSLAPTNSTALTLIGDSFLSASRLDDAAAAYSAAVALQPRNTSALVGLGRVYAARGRVADAEASLRRALAVAPTHQAAQAALGRVLLNAGRPAEAIPFLEGASGQQGGSTAAAVRDLADAYLASDRIEEGLAIYRANLDLDEESQRLVIGQALLNAGRIDAGLAELQAYVESRPDDVAGWLALAQGQQLAGDAAALEQAEAAYERAMEAAPADLTVRIQSGDFLLAQQRSQEAAARFAGIIAVLEQEERLDQVRQPAAAASDSAGSAPVELWRAWIGLARARQQLGQYDAALEAAQAGETLRPDISAFALQIGDIQRAAGRSDEALAAYQRAAAFGVSTAPLNRIGDLYLRLGEPDKALTSFEAALALAPDDADALLGLARAYALRGGGVDQADFANAEARLKRAGQLAPGNVNVSLALGDLYTVYGRHDEALAQYRAALAAAPESLLAQERLVGALRTTGQLEEALQEQLKLVELTPGQRGPLLNLAVIYRLLGRPEEAEATYGQILEQTPDDPTTLIALGDMKLEQGLASEAATIYQQALSHAEDPLLAAQASDQLGKAWLRLGEIQQAQAIADGLVRDQPALERGYLLQGSIFEAQDDREGALAAYRQGIDQVEAPQTLYLRLGNLLLRAGRPAEAQEVYSQLTRSNPRSEDAFVGLALAHVAQLPDLQALRSEWANQALAAALRLNPNSTTALAARGDLLTALQRPDEAAAAYAAALASRSAGSGDDTALRLRLANALAAAGQWAPALQEFQRMAIANPSDLGLQMALGNAYRASGRSEQALRQYRQINQIDPAYPFAYTRQGELLDELGRPDEALAAYQAAVAAAPENADALFTLAAVYRRRGLTEQAIAAYEAGLALDPSREGAQRALEELRSQ